MELYSFFFLSLLFLSFLYVADQDVAEGHGTLTGNSPMIAAVPDTPTMIMKRRIKQKVKDEVGEGKDGVKETFQGKRRVSEIMTEETIETGTVSVFVV